MVMLKDSSHLMTPQEVVNASGLNGTWVPLYKDNLARGDGVIDIDVSDYTQLIVTTASPGNLYAAFRSDISVGFNSTHSSFQIPSKKIVPIAVPRGYLSDKIYFSIYQSSTTNEIPTWIVGI